MRMIWLLGLVLVVITLSGCGSKPENALVGKWQSTQGVVADTLFGLFGHFSLANSIEFFKEGTVTAVVRGRTFGSDVPVPITGNYRWIDNDRIRVEMPQVAPIVYRVTINRGELKLSVDGQPGDLTFRKM